MTMRLLILLTICLSTFLACSPASPPKIEIEFASDIINVPQGNQVRVNFKIRSSASGEIQFSVLGLPIDIAYKVEKGATAEDRVLVFQANPEAAITSLPLTFQAVQGALKHEKTLTLVVQPTGFEISMANSNPKVIVGQGTAIEIQLQRQQFDGEIQLILEGIEGSSLPAGIQADPITTTKSGTVTLNLISQASILIRDYPLRIKATSGFKLKTFDFTLSVVANPNFTLGLQPNSVGTDLGKSSTFQIPVTINRANFISVVNLSLDPNMSNGQSKPIGISATFSETNTSGTNSQLTLNVGANVGAGIYPLQVRGVADGITRLADLTVIVRATNDFSIALEKTSVDIVRGQSLNLPLNIQRNNFTQAVEIQLELSPYMPQIGLSVGLTQSTVTGNTTNLLLSVPEGLDTTTANFVVKIRAVSGSLIRTLDLQVRVLPSPRAEMSIKTTPDPFKGYFVKQGQPLDLTWEIVRINCVGPVNLSLSQQDGSALPAGLTGSFSSNPVNEDLFTLTLQPGATLPATLYRLKVSGLCGGASSITEFALLVEPVQILQVTTGVGTVSLPQGSSMNIPILASSTGVSLAKAGVSFLIQSEGGGILPVGLTGIFTPSSGFTGESTLTLTAAPTLALQTYNLQIVAQSQATAKTVIALNVTQPATGLSIISRKPAPADTSVIYSKPIEVVFSKPIDPASIGSATITLVAGNQNLTFTSGLSSDHRTLTLMITAPSSQIYFPAVANIKLTGIKAEDGTTLAATSWGWNLPLWISPYGSTSPEKSGEFANISFAALASDRQRHPYLVWAQTSGSIISLIVTYWDGSNWIRLPSPYQVDLNTIQMYSDRPAILVDASGAPMVSFLNYTPGKLGLEVRRFDGSSWVNLATGLGSGVLTDNSRMVLDRNGKPLLAAKLYGSSFMHTVVQWDGVRWNQLGQMDSPSSFLPLSFTVDSTNQIWAAKNSTSGPFATLFRWSGTAWDPQGGLLGSYADCPPSVAIDAQDRPWVIWCKSQYNPNLVSLFVSRWSGTAWEQMGSPLNFDPTQQPEMPSIVIDGQNRPVVAWRENFYIMVKRWDNNQWVELSNSLQAYTGGYDYSLGLDEVKMPLLVWHQVGSGQNRLEVKSLNR